MEDDFDNTRPPLPPYFGKFKVAGYLSQGAYGYTALVHTLEDREPDAVVKWLRPDAEKKGALRFQNEVWALQQLDHRAIPRYLDQGQQEDRPWFAMTLARGRPLGTYLEQQRLGGQAMGEIVVLDIAARVLEALAAMHTQDICHRDVKDDNIMVEFSDPSTTPRQVTLVDLGVCKGVGQPVDVETFWPHVGARRYSPPEKWEHPARLVPNHDVFAVGVVCYLLLTNHYPWMVLDRDGGDLKNQMIRRKPQPIHHINSLVHKKVALFVAKLLDIDDQKRPSSADALNEAQALLQELRTKSITSSGIPVGTESPLSITPALRIPFPRVLRDPLHGDIRLTEFEWRIIKSKEFQRLRWQRQLGFTNLVYPGAEHTRLLHSIGTLHTTEKVLKAIEDFSGDAFDTDERLMARTYALVHDITHIPYGHTLEDELGLFVRHDENKERIDRLVHAKDSQVGEVLGSTDYGRAVLSFFDIDSPNQPYLYIKEIVEGRHGADVLDYIDRDSYFSGVHHRVDSAIYRRLSLVEDQQRNKRFVYVEYGRHGRRPDAKFAPESLLLERFSLFLKLFTHPAKLSAGAMLGKALAQIIRTGKSRRVKADLEKQIEQMGDIELLLFLKANKDSTVKQLASMLLERELYKPIFRASALKESNINMRDYGTRQVELEALGIFDSVRRSYLEDEFAKAVGTDPSNIIVYCPTSAPGLPSPSSRSYALEKPGELTVEGTVRYRPILERHLGLWTVYVFVSPFLDARVWDKLSSIAEDKFALKNDVTVDHG